LNVLHYLHWQKQVFGKTARRIARSPGLYCSRGLGYLVFPGVGLLGFSAAPTKAMGMSGLPCSNMAA